MTYVSVPRVGARSVRAPRFGGDSANARPTAGLISRNDRGVSGRQGVFAPAGTIRGYRSVVLGGRVGAHCGVGGGLRVGRSSFSFSFSASLERLASRLGEQGGRPCARCKQTAKALDCSSRGRNRGSNRGRWNPPAAGGDDGNGARGAGEDGDGGDGSFVLEGSALLKTPGSQTEDIVVLDVTGMMCAGCVSRVRQILLDEACVLGASVNLPTETAVVRVIVGAQGVHDDHKYRGDHEGGGDLEANIPAYSAALQRIGERLALLLSDKGYEAKFRPFGAETSAATKVVQAKREERIRKLREKTVQVVIAWGLASACMIHHVVHWFGMAAPRFVHVLGSTMGTAALSAMALLGPGRGIVVDGFKNLVRGTPDMNSLVGLGATTAFGISTVAMLLPKLGWRTFFEEPAMLLCFILLGRALEE